MIGHKRVPSREGGVEIVVEELSTRMVQQGSSVTCYNRRGHHVSGKEFDGEDLREYKGVRIRKVFTINRKGLAAMSASVTAAFHAIFGRYDIVHFHAEGPCAMLWLPKLFGKRCIATIHGLDHRRTKWGWFARRYLMLGEKCAVKYADEMIVLSRNMQEYFRRIYGRETSYIPNGVSRAVSRAADLITRRFGLKKDSYLLFVGRIVPEKGLTYLLDAFGRVKTDKKLVIVGGSSDTEDFMNELKSMSRMDNRVLWTGFIQEQQVLSELYSNAYIFILPSDLEGMPLSLLEAMSYNNCCLISDIPECVEVVEDKAVLFKKSSVSDLREKLQELCDHQSVVQKYKDAAADFICGKYVWDDVAGKTLKLYRGGVDRAS